MTSLRIFIGYDERESVAYHVLAHSIQTRASVPVSITPLIRSQLPLTRERGPMESTDFAFTRFLVPWLCGYRDIAVFMDCDMLCRGDIANLFDYWDGVSPVQVVQHDYTPRTETKFLDQPQTVYPCKNWSSVMLFNCTLCPILTPEYVNERSGLELHQFKWVGDTRQVGMLPKVWNHLVGEYERNPDVQLVHFTLGTPCFPAFKECEYADEWRREYVNMIGYETRNAHVKPRSATKEAA